MTKMSVSLPIRISSPKTEGILQVSKWLKVQLFLDADEMEELIKTLAPTSLVVVSEPIKADEAIIAPKVFLERYADYTDLLKRGRVPIPEEFRRFFSCAISSILETFYAIPTGNDKFLIKPTKPVLQLQAHHFFYSDLDGKFHPMVLSSDSISWGLQISYPQLYQDPVTRQVVKVTDSPDFPNTALFAKLLKWMRNNTLPTPFEVKGTRINSPIRIGKKSLTWIKNHPQLKQKSIQVLQLGKT
jgi:hypothetical protein